MTASTQAMTVSTADEVFGEAKKSWGWLLALGILFIILGVVGLGMSVALTLVGVLFFGWLVIVGGLVQVVEVFKIKGWKSVLWHVLMALVYLLVGGVILYDPAGGAIALTFLIAIALFTLGVLRAIMAFHLKGVQGWWLPLLGGLLTIVLGTLILAEWPSSGLWVIGLFIAIELLINGLSYVMFALTARQAAKQVG